MAQVANQTHNAFVHVGMQASGRHLRQLHDAQGTRFFHVRVGVLAGTGVQGQDVGPQVGQLSRGGDRGVHEQGIEKIYQTQTNLFGRFGKRGRTDPILQDGQDKCK